ncbi:bifunctional diaminohydroxyphosphoribosylaminopyrimidine deaminase/5-amino-6-(5-phosphoribosylamino)uracil reductase RibD [Mesorhizobium sp. BAC0120]|uniref:bifunctional diaminohydroxyphosphoribosylaminopyrimidine deaminase/5-amino-6-(5-phosphoribosylamino)uracil reductase RibD n=1 Tax=Mesorhizobium sp. BAC0120 TaxID=3090670 RepID=UPI00298BF838|nr:bifunctional diaminohydroxyphosphoribosylaminopyrimidine deaminase/5-amino-6-(5-phosphoribosylamino)uracil reductase RibD [Mesorhizobium sp. BAC0120]MDW6021388.1 bifunctional diaminohydroxyphosphoribosylaminopyrimidine deaminase/5-amino-6-(5-phosphoribosylamino)uracil reductase RibD [Mesorhizobium sp. BAC0120]
MLERSASARQEALDRRFMAAAIRLSRQHLGLTAENPSVGSLVVREVDGVPTIVGRGVTALGGRPHAELQALGEAGEGARGATIYATLEPCSHIGKAPPCADAIVAAGARRVVIATLDPDIRVAGRGVAILKRAGIEVDVGCEEVAAKRAMAGFLTLRAKGRPFVTLKLAVSADGRIGRVGAGQVSITGPIARRAVQIMRVEHDAVMVGVQTVVEDDPLLTVRLDGLAQRSPLRVVVDPLARTPLAARMFSERDCSRVLVLASAKAQARAVGRLRDRGATVETITSDYKGRFEPREILRHLGVRGVKSVLLEGGAETARRFLEAGLVDRIALFAAETVVGESGVAAPIAEDSVPPDFNQVGEESFGSDRLIEYERPL